MKKTFGGKMPTVEAIERPELLFSSRNWMSGKNIAGNAEETWEK